MKPIEVELIAIAQKILGSNAIRVRENTLGPESHGIRVLFGEPADVYIDILHDCYVVYNLAERYRYANCFGFSAKEVGRFTSFKLALVLAIETYASKLFERHEQSIKVM